MVLQQLYVLISLNQQLIKPSRQGAESQLKGTLLSWFDNWINWSIIWLFCFSYRLYEQVTREDAENAQSGGRGDLKLTNKICDKNEK